MVACAQPPAEVVTTARQAEQVAIAEGAREYAPDALNSVAEARAALDAELAAQQERWAVRRSYKHAEELAQAYRAASERATAEATEAREEAHAAAVALITESRTMLDEARAMLAAAPAGKGSAADLAAMRADLDAAQAGLDAADASVASELYLEAKASATSAREIIDRVRSAVEAARTIRRG